MSFVDDDRHTFVIRLWREPRELESVDRPWRGTIEHIPSGDRRPVAGMKDITSFIDDCVGVTARRQLWQRTVQAWLSRHLSSATEEEAVCYPDLEEPAADREP